MAAIFGDYWAKSSYVMSVGSCDQYGKESVWSKSLNAFGMVQAHAPGEEIRFADAMSKDSIQSNWEILSVSPLET